MTVVVGLFVIDVQTRLTSCHACGPGYSVARDFPYPSAIL